MHAEENGIYRWYYIITASGNSTLPKHPHMHVFQLLNILAHAGLVFMKPSTNTYIYKDLKNIKNVKGCRDGMPKSMQTR